MCEDLLKDACCLLMPGNSSPLLTSLSVTQLAAACTDLSCQILQNNHTEPVESVLSRDEDTETHAVLSPMNISVWVIFRTVFNFLFFIVLYLDVHGEEFPRVVCSLTSHSEDRGTFTVTFSFIFTQITKKTQHIFSLTSCVIYAVTSFCPVLEITTTWSSRSWELVWEKDLFTASFKGPDSSLLVQFGPFEC